MSDDNSSNWRQVQEIFSAVADLPPLQQEKKIDELSCGNDQLKKEVQSLLEFDSNTQIICSAAAENSPYRTGQQIDQFRLAFPLAANAKTEVWKAICDSEPIDSPQRFAAVKILNHTNLQERHQVRFVQEARVLAQFDHSGVAKFMGAGTTPNAHPYVATQFVDGEDIYNYAVGKQLDLRQRIELVISVCKAVEYSHQHLVIHRDLKPENILVDQSGNPVVIDFGISKRLQDEGFNQIELTQTLDRPMTPAYASPEQVRGEPVSAVTDVYSIGLILYQLITGVHPYTDWAHESGTPLFDRITTATPKLPTALIGANLQELSLPGDSSLHFNSHLPAEPQQLKRNLKAGLQFIVMKAIQKSPEDRYQSVAQMRRDLVRFNAGKMTSEPAILNTARKNLATSLAIAMICGVALGLLPWLLGLQTTRTTGNEQMSFAAATNQPKQPSFDQQIKIAKRAAHEKNYPLALQIAEDLETGLESVTTSQRFQVANIFFLLGMPQKALATTQLTPSQFATAATKDPQLDKHRHTFCLTLIQCGQADIVRSLNGKSPYETQTRLQQDLVESMIRESNDWHDGVLQILNRIQPNLYFAQLPDSDRNHFARLIGQYADELSAVADVRDKLADLPGAWSKTELRLAQAEKQLAQQEFAEALRTIENVIDQFQSIGLPNHFLSARAVMLPQNYSQGEYGMEHWKASLMAKSAAHTPETVRLFTHLLGSSRDEVQNFEWFAENQQPLLAIDNKLYKIDLLRKVWQGALASGKLSAAQDIAKQLVELSQEVFGGEQIELADALAVECVVSAQQNQSSSPNFQRIKSIIQHNLDENRDNLAASFLETVDLENYEQFVRFDETPGFKFSPDWLFEFRMHRNNPPASQLTMLLHFVEKGSPANSLEIERLIESALERIENQNLKSEIKQDAVRRFENARKRLETIE